MIPLYLLIGALAVAGYFIGQSTRPKLTIRGSGPGRMRWNPAGHWERPPVGEPTYLEVLPQVLASGRNPSPILLEAAYNEARLQRDAQAMGLIEQLYLQLVGPQVGAAPAALEKQVTPEEFEDVTARPPAAAAPAVAAPPTLCPIPDVEQTNWVAFLSALRTKEPDYRSENHLGSYEHNRRRLRQLGIDEGQLANADGQYRALCHDLADYHERCKQLIDNHAGDVVEVPGKGPTPVTLSGILALLKTAGINGATGWLTRPEDRTKFTGTTEVFNRCNGCF